MCDSVNATKRYCSLLHSSSKIGILAMRPEHEVKLFIFANINEGGLVSGTFRIDLLQDFVEVEQEGTTFPWVTGKEDGGGDEGVAWMLEVSLANG